jgi:glycosyltransferase involved in cell wall biosynthesis
VDDSTMVEVLNTCDVCVNPDRPTEMNNLSTMNKIMEYMALRKPIVQYDLKEGRVSAQGASLYAENTSTKDFADKIEALLDDEEMRNRMGQTGYSRVIEELSWDHESRKLIDFYDMVLSNRTAVSSRRAIITE